MARIGFCSFDFQGNSPWPDATQAALTKSVGRIVGSCSTCSGSDSVGEASTQSVSPFLVGGVGAFSPTSRTYVLHAERFYFRIRQAPGANGLYIWHQRNNIASGGTSEGSPAGHITVNSDGTLSLWNQGNNATPVLILTTPNSYNDRRWHILKLVIQYNSNGNQPLNSSNAKLGISIDDPLPSTPIATWLTAPTTQVSGVIPLPNLGFNYGGNQGASGTLIFNSASSSVVGNDGGIVDIDDWVADSEVVPTNGFISVLRPTALGTFQQWDAQDYRPFLIQPYSTSNNGNDVSTVATTGGKKLSVLVEPGTTYSVGTIKSAAVVVFGGIVRPNWKTFVIVNGVEVDSVVNTNSSSSAGFKDPSNGATYPGNAFFLGNVAVATWSATDIIEVGVQDGNTGAGTSFVSGMSLILEHEAVDPPLPVSTGEIQIVTGSYTGNGTIQDVSLPMVPHFLLLKPVGASGAIWHTKMDSTGTYSQSANNADYGSNGLAGIRNNTDGTSIFSVVNRAFNVQKTNDNGVLVRYLAIRDPRRRMVLFGADAFDSASTSVSGKGDNVTVTFDKADFTPEAMLALGQFFSAASPPHLFYRGTAHVGDSSTPIDASSSAAIADGIQSMSTGTMQLGSLLLHSSINWMNYSAFRTLNVFSQNRLCSIGNYTGDGAVTRTITFPFPLYDTGMVFVVSHGAFDKQYRFKGEIGTSSHNWGGVLRNSTNGSITDLTTTGFTIANGNLSLLNSIGVIYDYIAFANGIDPAPVTAINIIPQWGIHNVSLKARPEERS